MGTDLFEIDGTHYLLTVDYFSRYPEVRQLTTTSSAAVISASKAVFAKHGIPETVRSDNGPQYSSHEFARFASTYEFKHITSSPRFPQSNGQVERMVKTVKSMLKRSQDPYVELSGNTPSMVRSQPSGTVHGTTDPYTYPTDKQAVGSGLGLPEELPGEE